MPVPDLAPGYTPSRPFMPLTAGTQIGPYRIVGRIGAGGMGEVYRATDRRLARDVAIKLIHETLAADPSRVRRFEQEARAAGQLNHPNILAVHDFGTHEGAPYIVSELLEGESLRARLQRGPLSLRETIDYARQVADGLAAAHAKGIVHRDLKPDNLFLTQDGRVKILDFGIAKLAQPTDDSGAPTDVAAQTAEGLVVGTLGYMSPEQLRGESVDQRSDLFSLGAILFEMLTGRQAFVRTTAAETMAAALKEDPLEKIDDGVSPTLSRFVSRCLEKRREARFQSARDLAFALEVLSGTSEIAAPDFPVTSRKRPRLTLIVGVAAIVVVAAVAIWLARDHAAASTDNLLAQATFTQLTNFESSEEDASISPDGKFVIFVSDRDGQFHIWRTQIGSGRFDDLTPGEGDQRNPGGIRAAGFSGDGFEIWLGGSNDNRLRRMPLLGGAPHAFLEEHTVNVAWAHDAKRLVYFTYDNGDPMMVVDGSRGQPRRIWINSNGDHNHFPAWSLDDRWIYFARGSQFPAEFDIWRISPEGGEPEQLTHHKSYIRYVTPIDERTVLYVAPDEDETGPWLWALDVEQKTSRRLSVGLEQYLSVAASADGRHLVASVANPTASLWTVPILDRIVDEREVKPYTVPATRALAPRFDKTGLLFYLSSTGERDGLFRLQDKKPLEIWKGLDGALAAPGAVSPLSDWVVVAPIRQGKRHLLLVSVDGATNQPLSDDVDVRGTSSWSSDAKWIVTGGSDAQGPGLFLVPADGGAPRKIRSGPAFDPVWSPTDDLILYTGQQRAGAPLLATRADGTLVDFPTISFPFGGGGRVRFLPDGKSIVYMLRSASGMDFWLMDLATKTSRPLTHFSNPATIFAFDVTADGRQIVFDRIRQNSDLRLIDLAR
jgi:serine/threonine protein kinase